MGPLNTLKKMEMCILVNTLLTRCTALESTSSAMDTIMRDRDMRAEDKGLVFTLFRNWEAQSGYWQSGLLVKASCQIQLPESLLSPCSCKISIPIQKARQASERAHNVETVNYKVNKVVAIANGAANAAQMAFVKAVQRRMHYALWNQQQRTTSKSVKMQT